MKTYLITIMTITALLAMSTAGWAQLITTDPSLPPDGDYISPLEFHTYAAAGIILDDPIHRPLAGSAIRGDDGLGNEIETFDSEFHAVEIGLGLGPMTLQGQTQVITLGKVGNTTGTFATEIIAMNLTGIGPGPFGPPIMVRIDPDPFRPTIGQTTITDLGGGLWEIDSFFDVFTELSPDGGLSWIPSDSSTHMELVPEPVTVLILALGLVPVLLVRARKR